MKSKKLKESETMELKTSLAEEREILDTISAFANTKGGHIYVGVEENKDGSVKEIVGVKIKGRMIENLTNEIKQNTDPVIFPSIKMEKIGDKEVLSMKIEENPLKPVFVKGKAYKRVGRSSLKLTVQEIRNLVKESIDYSFTELFCGEAALKDIDWDFVKKEFIPAYESISGRKIHGRINELLESLKCLKKNKLTNACILLFGREPQHFFMNAYVAVARYKGVVEGIERLDYKEFTGNLFKQIDGCDKYLKEHVAVMSRLHPYKVQREDIPEYGLFSIRELITNAVCHRDYAEQRSKVIIKMFKNRIEFYNPGGLPKDINPKNILRKQHSRNPAIAQVLAKVKYIEELGEGWNKIIEEHKKHPLKLKLPTIEADKESIVITLFSVKEKFEKKEKVEMILNERQKKAVDYLKEKGRITNEEYRKLNNANKKTSTRDLTLLVNKDILERIGKTGRGTYYVLRGHKGDIKGTYN